MGLLRFKVVCPKDTEKFEGGKWIMRGGTEYVHSQNGVNFYRYCNENK